MHPTTRTTTLRAAAITLALSAAACGSTRTARPDPTAAPPASRPASSAAASAASQVYKPPARDACSVLDHRLLAPLLGADQGTQSTPITRDTSVAVFANCDRRYQSATARNLVSVQVMIVKLGSASVPYEGLRGADERAEGQLTDVPGVGQGAYAYTDPLTGPHLNAYDGNLYLTLRVSSTNRTSLTATQIFPLLAETARHAMTALAST